MSMARGEIFTGRVERIASGGAGLTRVDGKSVFIDLTAPGDLIRGRITKEHRSWSEAELLEILEPSSLRVTPPCPFFGRCGGCSLQHLSYDAQIEAKTAILLDSCKRIGGFVLPEIRVRRSEPFGYRNRVQFHLDSENRPCFKERKSSRLVAIDDCPVADEGIRKALRERRIKPPEVRKRFNMYTYRYTFLVEGEVERGNVSILGRELFIDVGVFFQSNAAMLETLISDLLEVSTTVDKSLPLADIYCGVGTFAAFLAGTYGSDGASGSGGSSDVNGIYADGIYTDAFPEIDLVEENKTALALARNNLSMYKKVNYYALKDSEWIKLDQKRDWGLMVLDPPREGLSAAFREWLVRNGPRLVAYISCDPATLARDCGVLLKGEYTMRELTFYDFYPQTAHIESLAVFNRGRNACGE
jgi:23S rRNA (uracil1939-C5)-methyltransferase